MLTRMMLSCLGKEGRVCVKSADGPCSNSNTPNRNSLSLRIIFYLRPYSCELVIVLFVPCNESSIHGKLSGKYL